MQRIIANGNLTIEENKNSNLFLSRGGSSVSSRRNNIVSRRTWVGGLLSVDKLWGKRSGNPNLAEGPRCHRLAEQAEIIFVGHGATALGTVSHVNILLVAPSLLYCFASRPVSDRPLRESARLLRVTGKITCHMCVDSSRRKSAAEAVEGKVCMWTTPPPADIPRSKADRQSRPRPRPQHPASDCTELLMTPSPHAPTRP